MDKKYTWDLTDIFKSEEDFEKEILNLEKKFDEIKGFQGKLALPWM